MSYLAAAHRSLMPKSTFAAAIEPCPPVDLAELPSTTLQGMLAAGEELLEIERLLAKTGDSVIGELLREAGTFYEWEHYPQGDACDRETNSQYYYHAHPPEQRFPGEHGHFHTFLQPAGMPAGVKPAPRLPADPQDPRSRGDTAMAHLVAIAMNDRGQTLRLFTVNRWVTGETWYRAADVAAMLGRFSMDQVRPSWATNRWLTALLRLFAPQIRALVHQRDRCVATWQQRHPSADVLEDKRLEVTSWMPVSLDAQVDALRRQLNRA